MRVNVVYAVPPGSVKFDEWHDGFTAAMALVAAHHEVTWLNIHPAAPDWRASASRIPDADAVLIKSDWGWIPDAIAHRALRHHPEVLRALVISGSNPPPPGELLRFDALFYETPWYADQVQRHPHPVHAFGIDTSVMHAEGRSEHPKIDWLMVGRPAAFKRPERLAEKSGRRVLVGEAVGVHVETVTRLETAGVEVVDFVRYADLAAMYRDSATVLVPCELQGGGERSVLEGRACGCAVEIASDNPKLASLLEGPVLSHRDYAEALLRGLQLMQEAPVARHAMRTARRTHDVATVRRTLRGLPRLGARTARRLARRARSAIPREAIDRVLRLVRRGRHVIWTSEQFGLGNLLYEWMQADIRTRAGSPTVCLQTVKSEPWLRALPSIRRDIVIPRSAVRLWNQRIVHGGHFHMGKDFTAEDIERFVRRRLLVDSFLPERALNALGPADVAINVRRGDYYSEARWRRRYAFDIATFVDEALDEQVARGGPLTRIHVVSDDVPWCQEHLGPRLGARQVPVTYVTPEDTPGDHLAYLAGARRLILANSSFSYWGAYLSNVRHQDNHALVVSPWFHARLADGTPYGAIQLDPRWTVVTEIPGGWEPLPEDRVESEAAA